MKSNAACVAKIEDLVCNTPLIQIGRNGSDRRAGIYGKLESFNPGGSVKDRIALSMILDAENRGLLKRGGTIIEPTSGNTGIGLAMLGRSRGYRVMLVMPESMSMERRVLLSFLGAELELSPADQGMRGAISLTEEIRKAHPDYFLPDQFSNPANPTIHRRTTAVEIIRAMGAKSIDAFVAGVGTGGTITGAGEVLRGKYPNVRIVAVEPAGSAVLSGKPAGPHRIQGIGAGFIPRVLNTSIIDEVIPITDEDAFAHAQRLAMEEGILAGISSGAAYAAALQVAEQLGAQRSVVVVLPDTGERYLSVLGFAP